MVVVEVWFWDRTGTGSRGGGAAGNNSRIRREDPRVPSASCAHSACWFASSHWLLQRVLPSLYKKGTRSFENLSEPHS